MAPTPVRVDILKSKPLLKTGNKYKHLLYVDLQIPTTIWTLLRCRTTIVVALPIVSYLTVTVVERLITGVYDTFLVKVIRTKKCNSFQIYKPKKSTMLRYSGQTFYILDYRYANVISNC